MAHNGVPVVGHVRRVEPGVRRLVRGERRGRRDAHRAQRTQGGHAVDATAAPPSLRSAHRAAGDAPEIRLEGVSKVYPDGTVGVAELDLTFAAGELSVLVGPSGCGKTTTMKMVNRIIEPTTGRILLGGEDVTGVDADRLRRRIGYVIQSVGLFPHQTVRANVATVPRLLGWDRREIRERLQSEFLRLQEAVRKTIVFVTHDIEEAVRLGDRIAVMSTGGHVEQFAPPTELLGRPANRTVADLVGADRGLKRLAVTPIEPADLEQPPVVGLTDGLAEAGAALDRAGAGWAVVLDDAGRPAGWLPAGRASGAGTVASAFVRDDAAVPLQASLRTVLATMLQSDAGWVPVLDGDRHLGVLTPAALHAALRRSVHEGAR